MTLYAHRWNNSFFFPPGILEVLHCVLVESPEALNIIKEGHIKSIICLLDKHGRNHKVGKDWTSIFRWTKQAHSSVWKLISNTLMLFWWREIKLIQKCIEMVWRNKEKYYLLFGKKTLTHNNLWGKWEECFNVRRISELFYNKTTVWDELHTITCLPVTRYRALHCLT